jgi:hypothetical protein
LLLFGDHRFGLFGLFLATAGAVVQLALVCRLAALRARRRELCLELIIGGSQGMPLACLERESRRLLEPRTLERLATRRATDCRSGAWNEQRLDRFERSTSS